MSDYQRRKSSRSATSNCVEAQLRTRDDVRIGDSKLSPRSRRLTFVGATWQAFLEGTKKRPL